VIVVVIDGISSSSRSSIQIVCVTAQAMLESSNADANVCVNRVDLSKTVENGDGWIKATSCYLRQLSIRV
jgi:hypothetical protein